MLHLFLLGADDKYQVLRLAGSGLQGHCWDREGRGVKGNGLGKTAVGPRSVEGRKQVSRIFKRRKAISVKFLGTYPQWDKGGGLLLTGKMKGWRAG